MKNKEKFTEELLDLIIYSDELAFNVDEYTVKGCSETNCCNCLFKDVCNCGDDISNYRRKWLEAEYVEPEPESEIDWSKVPVDTPILVRHNNNDDWIPRYFDKYENGIIYAWWEGATSWSAQGHTLAWEYAKLLED